MTTAYTIRRADADEATAEALATITLDVVEGGASVGFMLPLSRERALQFWRDALASMRVGDRVVLVATDAAGTIDGTVTLITAMPDNQPHRGDIAKMQVHRRARRRGLGEQLMRAAEATARAAGKTLLVLDTVTDSDACRLYARCGWVRVGDIPDYALWPQGGYCSTTVFYRRLG